MFLKLVRGFQIIYYSSKQQIGVSVIRVSASWIKYVRVQNQKLGCRKYIITVKSLQTILLKCKGIRPLWADCKIFNKNFMHFI